jgi:hypothetical protein
MQYTFKKKPTLEGNSDPAPSGDREDATREALVLAAGLRIDKAFP